MAPYLLEKISRGIHKFRVPILILLVVVIGALLINNFTITGEVTGIAIETHFQELNLVLNQTQNYIWNLENYPNSLFQLTYLKISGSLSGDKNVKVYVENKKGIKFLVFDGSALQVKKNGEVSVTGNSVGKFEGIFEALEKKISSSPELLNLSEVKNISEKEKLILSFDSACLETCNLKDKGFNLMFYKLVFEIPKGTVVNINGVEYSLEKKEVITQQLTVNLKNILRYGIMLIGVIK